MSEYHGCEFTLDPGANALGFDDEVEVRVDGALAESGVDLPGVRRRCKE